MFYEFPDLVNNITPEVSLPILKVEGPVKKLIILQRLYGVTQVNCHPVVQVYHSTCTPLVKMNGVLV